jgi:ArsR family transcriptional regulator, arsenate/arsenite/antimonite-responsive transcriptional repressor
VQEKVFIKIAKALADPTRHSIVREVRKAGELTCSQVCDGFSCSQPTISHHIKTLEEAGIIKVREDGTFRRLTIDDALLDEFARSIQGSDSAKPKRRKA